MRIDIMTLFPDTVGDVLSGVHPRPRAGARHSPHRTHQIRDYTANRQNQVDDYPYGGGHGAVLQADPLYRCWCHVCDEAGAPVHTIYLSPPGMCLTRATPAVWKNGQSCFCLAGITKASTSASSTSASTRSFPSAISSSPAVRSRPWPLRTPSAALCRACCPMRPALRTRATGRAHWSIPNTAAPPSGTACACRISCSPATTPGRALAQEAVHPPHAGAPSRPVCRPAARKQGRTKKILREIADEDEDRAAAQLDRRE